MKDKITQLLILAKEWREERHISLDVQRKNYPVNVFEELGELAQAIREDNVEDMIDAYCDIFVFTLNLFDDKSYIFELDTTYNSSTFAEDFLFSLSLLLAEIPYRNTIALEMIYHYLKGQCKTFGYDFFECMQETFKEINSRTGSYSEKQGKWLKDTSPEAQAKWYKADYSKCRL